MGEGERRKGEGGRERGGRERVGEGGRKRRGMERKGERRSRGRERAYKRMQSLTS